MEEITATPQLLDAETYGQVDGRVVSLARPASAAAEQYRVLALRLERAAKDGIKRIAVTSAIAGEGRTLTAVNTALALGRGRRNRVMLVDANLRAPSVHTALGLVPREGIVDVVRGTATLDQTLWRFGDDDLWVLPAGTTTEPHVHIGARKMGETLDELGKRADLVVLDAPPVLPTADMPSLARHVDGVVMVVRAGRTSRELVEMALERLDGTHVIGCVLVGIEREAGAPWKLCAEHDEKQRKLLPAHKPRGTER